MKTLKFKTNAKCGGCVAAIGEKLNKLMASDAWSIDLKDPNKVLTVSAEVAPDAIISAVTKKAGKEKISLPALFVFFRLLISPLPSTVLAAFGQTVVRNCTKRQRL